MTEIVEIASARIPSKKGRGSALLSILTLFLSLSFCISSYAEKHNANGNSGVPNSGEVQNIWKSLIDEEAKDGDGYLLYALKLQQAKDSKMGLSEAQEKHLKRITWLTAIDKNDFSVIKEMEFTDNERKELKLDALEKSKESTIDIYKVLLSKMDASRDVFLIKRINKRIDELNNKMLAKQYWESQIKSADTLLRNNYAKEAFDLLSASNKDYAIPPEVFSQVLERTRMAKEMSVALADDESVEKKKVELERFIPRAIWSAFYILATILYAVLVVGLLALALRKYHIYKITKSLCKTTKPRTTQINIKDLRTKEEDGENNKSSQSFGATIVQIVKATENGAYRRCQYTEVMDKTRTLMAPMEVGTAAPENSPITVALPAAGRLTIDPMPLIKWIWSKLTQPGHDLELEGTLRNVSPFGIEFIGTVKDLMKHSEEPPQRCSEEPPQRCYVIYAFDASGTAEEVVLEKIAAQLVIKRAELLRKKVEKTTDNQAEPLLTKDAESLWHYQRGLDKYEEALSGGAQKPPQPETDQGQPGSTGQPLQGPSGCVEEASRLLQASVRYDPKNWLARYYLGFVLRRRSRYMDAAQQYHFLSEQIDRLPHMKWYKDNKYPLLKELMEYQMASAWARSHDENAVKEGRTLLGELADRLVGRSSKSEGKEDSGHGHNPNACELSLICKAEQLIALQRLMEMEGFSEERYGEICKFFDEFTSHSDVKGLYQSIMEHYAASSRESKERASDEAQLRPEFVEKALTTALTAMGNACLTNTPVPNAACADYLWGAINVQQLAPEPEPYIVLAGMYLKNGMAASPRWAEQALFCLEQALRIRPWHQRACLLMGQLLTHPVIGRHTEAKAYLERAGESLEAKTALAENMLCSKAQEEEGIKILLGTCALAATGHERGEQVSRCIAALKQVQITLPDTSLCHAIMDWVDKEVPNEKKMEIKIWKGCSENSGIGPSTTSS